MSGRLLLLVISLWNILVLVTTFLRFLVLLLSGLCLWFSLGGLLGILRLLGKCGLGGVLLNDSISLLIVVVNSVICVVMLLTVVETIAVLSIVVVIWPLLLALLVNLSNGLGLTDLGELWWRTAGSSSGLLLWISNWGFGTSWDILTLALVEVVLVVINSVARVIVGEPLTILKLLVVVFVVVIVDKLTVHLGLSLHHIGLLVMLLVLLVGLLGSRSLGLGLLSKLSLLLIELLLKTLLLLVKLLTSLVVLLGELLLGLLDGLLLLSLSLHPLLVSLLEQLGLLSLVCLNGLSSLVGGLELISGHLVELNFLSVLGQLDLVGLHGGNLAHDVGA